MYLSLLAPNDQTFVNAINRSFPRFRTRSLDAVVAAVQAAQLGITAPTLAAIIRTMRDWRNNEPNEYGNRGGTDGVAYRLWMETKQLIKNRFFQNIAYPDPPIPGNLPGDLILNIYVPPGEGHVEICHGFAYRWAVAAGKVALSPALSCAFGTAYNAGTVTPVLYPLGPTGYPAARQNGNMMVQPGDVVGMFVPPPNPLGTAVLGHSLIAESATVWFSANNAGTFGVGTGRSRINTAGGGFPMGAGWQGNGNQWLRPDGVVVDVVYRR